MSVRHFFSITLGQVKNSTVTFKTFPVCPEVRYRLNYLNKQTIPGQLMWKATSLCTYVTSTVNQAAGTKANRLSAFVTNGLKPPERQFMSSRFLHGYVKYRKPNKMKNYYNRSYYNIQGFKLFMEKTRATMLMAPKAWWLPLMTTMAGLTEGMRQFYKSHLVPLPLGGRMAFRIMSDDESIALCNQIDNRHANLLEVLTTWDGQGNATDARTLRVERIMEQLRRANPELDQHLTPGARWQALCVRRVDPFCNFYYTPASSADNGVIRFCPYLTDMLDDDEVSFVIAHEMTHAILRHGAEKLSMVLFFQKFFYNLLAFVNIPRFDDEEYIHNIAQEKGLWLEDSTAMEKEADEFGFQFACKACFDYRKFGAFITKTHLMKAADILGQGRLQNVGYFEDIGEYMEGTPFREFSDHPSDEDRLAKLESLEWRAKAEAWRHQMKCGELPASNAESKHKYADLGKEALEKIRDFKSSDAGRAA